MEVNEAIRKATRQWIDGFNAIPLSLIQKAYPLEESEFELTQLTGRLWVCSYCGGEYDADEVDSLAVDENDERQCSYCGHGPVSQEDGNSLGGQFPAWGTMWTFGEWLDEEWAKSHLDDMDRCGFVVYESDELGLFFGIDGAGYDFYEQHWIPLYLARGLQWHEHIEGCA